MGEKLIKNPSRSINYINNTHMGPEIYLSGTVPAWQVRSYEFDSDMGKEKRKKEYIHITNLLKKKKKKKEYTHVHSQIHS